MFKVVKIKNNVYIIDTDDNSCSSVSPDTYDVLSGFIDFSSDGIMLLHHGSHNGIKGNIKPESRSSCDFGTGFYTATLIDYALSNIITEKRNGHGYYYGFLADFNGLRVFDFKDDLRFWMLYTAYNRGYIDNIRQYNRLYQMIQQLNEYDVIKGLVEDDRSAYAFGRFLSNAITDECLMECLKYFDLGYQYVFKTEKACSHLGIAEIAEIQGDEYNKLSSNKSKRLNEAKNAVEEIEEKYEGVGKTFRRLIKEYD